MSFGRAASVAFTFARRTTAVSSSPWSGGASSSPGGPNTEPAEGSKGVTVVERCPHCGEYPGGYWVFPSDWLEADVAAWWAKNHG